MNLIHPEEMLDNMGCKRIGNALVLRTKILIPKTNLNELMVPFVFPHFETANHFRDLVQQMIANGHTGLEHCRPPGFDGPIARVRLDPTSIWVK